MSRKTRPQKRSRVRKSDKRQLVHWSGKFDRRTLAVASILAASLIATVAYARWRPINSPETTRDKRASSKNDAANLVKNVARMSADELAAIPPEALHPSRPEPRGYNASRGGFPPGALPSGVVLPGITDTGRTMAQGYGVDDGVRHQFTGKERDTETGLDYFGARYYSSAQGRFTSADPFNVILNRQLSTDPRAAQEEFTRWLLEPQRWNKYAYALNNPLRYVDPDGEDPQESALQVLQKAVQRLGGFRGIASQLIGKGNVTATATTVALETVLGKSIVFSPRGLNPAEVEQAKEVSAFEGRSFLGTPAGTAGIDGFLHDGRSPTNNPQPIQLQENSTGGVRRIVADAEEHAYKANNAGLKNLDLYVKYSGKDVTVSSVLEYIRKDGNLGMVGMTNKGTFKAVTILTQDGAVRIQRGKVYSCDNNGRCTAQ